MLQFLDEDSGWVDPDPVRSRSYRCGYCDQQVASDRGFRIERRGEGQTGGVHLCPGCHGPTFFAPDGRQFPRPPSGHPVEHVPTALEQLYEEARRSIAHRCYTGAALLCKKILHHMARTRGAPDEASFVDCIIFLEEGGYIPPDGSHWVNHVGQQNRDDGDRIRVRSAGDAEDLLRFTEMLLRFNYEFPNLIGRSGSGSSARGSVSEPGASSSSSSSSRGSPSAREETRSSYSRGKGNGSFSSPDDREIELGDAPRESGRSTRRPGAPSDSPR